MTRWIIFFALAFCLTGCETLNQKDQLERFQTSLTQYSAAWRWGRISEAHSFHVSRDGKQPSFDRDKLENFSVTGYKILERTVNAKEATADLYVEFSYYNERQGNLKKIREKQFWWYKEDIKRWLTEADIPDFK